MESLEIIVSKDGSHTLFNAALNETYHSIHGARQESVHVFIENGLKEIAKTHAEIRILEVGFGTGLNALLTYIAALDLGIKVKYNSLETFPLPSSIWESLNYPADSEKLIFKALHAAPWGVEYELAPHFTLLKEQVDLLWYNENRQFDLVYFDAFAPNKQPELWTEAVFSRILALCAPQAMLTTYCSKGDVRRAMLAAGWNAVRRQGPPGKREMLIAYKNA